MKRLAQHTAAFYLMAVMAFSAGCKKEDPDHLSAVGRTIGSKVGGVMNKTNDRLTLQWSEKCDPQTAPVELRVRERLQWDKDLEGSAIQVSGDGKHILLGGTVVSEEQKARAVSLAGNTTGVESVTQRLDIGSAPHN